MSSARDDFIAALVAALKENDTALLQQSHATAAQRSAVASRDTATGSSSSSSDSPSGGSDDDEELRMVTGLFAPKTPLARDVDSIARHAYEQLQFDFPIIDDAALQALAQQYRRLASTQARDPDSVTWAISNTMIDGIEYLTGASATSATSTSRGSEASGLLAAAVLLLVPRRLLEDDMKVSSPASDLLSRLQPQQPSNEPPMSSHDALQRLQQQQTRMMNSTDDDAEKSELLVELLAAEEDPDDLSLVYEADDWHLDAARSPAVATRQSVSASVVAMTPREQLRYLASKTFPSLLSSISLERWTEWGLDDALATIIRLLLSAEGDSMQAPLCGPHGEWQRYLFLWRDQLLRLRATSPSLTPSLDKLWPLAQWIHGAVPSRSNDDDEREDALSTAPLRVVLRVVAELTQSQTFAHDLARGMPTLHPLVRQELERLAQRYRKEEEAAEVASFAARHSDHVLVVVQLLRFELRLATAAAAERLQTSGLLRAALGLVPSTPTEKGLRDAVWLAPLLRLLAESALWSAVVASFVLRVPRLRALWERLQSVAADVNDDVDDAWAVERCLLSLAARQHRVDVAAGTTDELLPGETLFPARCRSFLDAMHQVRDATTRSRGCLRFSWHPLTDLCRWPTPCTSWTPSAPCGRHCIARCESSLPLRCDAFTRRASRRRSSTRRSSGHRRSWRWLRGSQSPRCRRAPATKSRRARATAIRRGGTRRRSASSSSATACAAVSRRCFSRQPRRRRPRPPRNSTKRRRSNVPLATGWMP
ncbi:hypothetical protein PINS_up012294 [Pythium insidiosum]|nr:hypothetical protein PINS_up012294 [Pythium insidiosum]